MPGSGSNWSDLVELPGSMMPPPPEEERTGRLDPSSRLVVSVYLNDGGLAAEADAGEAPAFGIVRVPAADIMDYVRSCGLDVQFDGVSRRMQVTGTVEQLERCFGTALSCYRSPDGVTYVAPDGPIYFPRDLATRVVGVFGFDTRPIARRHG